MKKVTRTAKAGTTQVATHSGLLAWIARSAAATLCLSWCVSVSGQESSPRNEGHLAIGQICADRQVPDSVLYVRGRAASLPAESRYEFLAQWVLPSAGHTTFRLAIDFTTTNPAPRGSHGVGNLFHSRDIPTDKAFRENDSRPLSGTVRGPSGGELVSPALDLVEIATSLNRLGELRSRIERIESPDELQQRCRLSMLALVDLAAEEYDQAAKWLGELFSRVETRTYEDFAGRWPETLAVYVGLQHPRTHEAAAEMLYRMLQGQLRTGVARGPDAWDRWVTAAAGNLSGLRSRLETTDAPTENAASVDAERDSYWQPVSKSTGWSRGRGLSPAAWLRHPGMVVNVASHTEDYLYYRSPLRGNFEVECDVTAFHWRDSHLLVAGAYVAPIYDHVSYGHGSFRAAQPLGVIAPRLSECDEWMRYRAVVRDHTCSTYFNGRLIHTAALPVEHDPWLAIRSNFDTDGAVRNLRITGTPVVPEQIHLSASNDLTGWYAYYDEPVSGDNDPWRQRGDIANGGGIVGRHEPGLNGLACERLLQYHRPMLEDGTIEYEFYYREGEAAVHPALDRRAWILDSQGIQTHWITDGTFERNGLDPLNLTDEAANRRGPRSWPLKLSAWNHLRLTLAGNAVDLALNEEPIYHGELESTNQRTFGLFHWCDQTEARVRNVIWRGGWPRELPTVESQELAGPGTRWLDERLPQLTARYEHDFTRDGLPLDRFLTETSSRQSVEASADGVRVVVPGRQGYTPWWIGPHLQLQGDFDVRAEFENLQLSGTMHSSTGVYLMIITADSETTHAGVYRGCLRTPRALDRTVVQAEFNRHKPTGAALSWPGSTAEESTSGTLRLARRGDTIYCLFAEADSPNFRLVHSEVVPRQATRFDGVRLMSSIFSALDGPCEVAVTWKRLSIWAEQIGRPPPRQTPDDGSNLESTRR